MFSQHNDSAFLTKELTSVLQMSSNRSTSFLGLQKVTKFLASRYISKAVDVGLSTPDLKVASTLFRTSLSMRILKANLK
jgi:hypothetical protein